MITCLNLAKPYIKTEICQRWTDTMKNNDLPVVINEFQDLVDRGVV